MVPTWWAHHSFCGERQLEPRQRHRLCHHDPLLGLERPGRSLPGWASWGAHPLPGSRLTRAPVRPQHHVITFSRNRTCRLNHCVALRCSWDRKRSHGIPGWRSGLAPAFGPGRDPGRPGIESHIGLPVHGACFSLRLCLCLSLSLSV